MKIIINESQLKFLNEDLDSLDDVSYEMKESIALWCLTNEFRYFVPNGSFWKKVSVANSQQINKEICMDIMKGTLTLSNENKELFGYNDYDDFENGDDEREEYMNGYNIYKVHTVNEDYYIEVSDNITEYSGEIALQDYADGVSGDEETIGWFHKIFR